jgi:hypothetical protein
MEQAPKRLKHDVPCMAESAPYVLIDDTDYPDIPVATDLYEALDSGKFNVVGHWFPNVIVPDGFMQGNETRSGCLFAPRQKSYSTLKEACVLCSPCADIDVRSLFGDIRIALRASNHFLLDTENIILDYMIPEQVFVPLKAGDDDQNSVWFMDTLSNRLEVVKKAIQANLFEFLSLFAWDLTHSFRKYGGPPMVQDFCQFFEARGADVSQNAFINSYKDECEVLWLRMIVQPETEFRALFWTYRHASGWLSKFQFKSDNHCRPWLGTQGVTQSQVRCLEAAL